MSRRIVRLYASMVVLPAAVATLVDKLATWLAIARIPTPSQAHVEGVFLVEDTAVASGEEWSATTGQQHATSAVDQITMHVTARHRR